MDSHIKPQITSEAETETPHRSTGTHEITTEKNLKDDAHASKDELKTLSSTESIPCWGSGHTLLQSGPIEFADQRPSDDDGASYRTNSGSFVDRSDPILTEEGSIDDALGSRAPQVTETQNLPQESREDLANNDELGSAFILNPQSKLLSHQLHMERPTEDLTSREFSLNSNNDDHDVTPENNSPSEAKEHDRPQDIESQNPALTSKEKLSKPSWVDTGMAYKPNDEDVADIIVEGVYDEVVVNDGPQNTADQESTQECSPNPPLGIASENHQAKMDVNNAPTGPLPTIADTVDQELDKRLTGNNSTDDGATESYTADTIDLMLDKDKLLDGEKYRTMLGASHLSSQASTTDTPNPSTSSYVHPNIEEVEDEDSSGKWEEYIDEVFGDVDLHAFDAPLTPSSGEENPPTEGAKVFNTYLESINKDKFLPRAETPKGFASEVTLHEHQKIALHWMLAKEKGKHGGGILADDMGLGKTVEIIALILAHPFQRQTAPISKLGGKATPTTSYGATNNGVTLIVAPASLLQQWGKEVFSKTNPHLSVLRYDSTSKKNISPRNIIGMNVVLVSYETLLSDWNKSIKHKKTLFFDPDFKFNRVVLDEGHRIKNRLSQTSEACCNLNAVYRWYVSGTPIQNNLAELFPAFRFLRVPNYGVWDQFCHLVLESSSVVQSIKNIHKTLGEYLLRRKKDSLVDGKIIVDLPKKHDIEVVYANFTPEQMDFYQAFQQETKLKFQKYLKSSNHGIDFKKALLLRLRQVCSHPWLVNFSKGDSLHKHLLNEQHLVINACFQFREPQIRKILSILKTAEETGETWKCEECGEKEVARIIPGCGCGICPACFTDIDPEANRELLELFPRACPHCSKPYEPLQITTLIGFQCAWVQDFRRDRFDEDETDVDRSEEQELAKRNDAFEVFRNRLRNEDGWLGTSKRLHVDPCIWGMKNVTSLWEIEPEVEFSFDCNDEEVAAEEEDMKSETCSNVSEDDQSNHGMETDDFEEPQPARKRKWDREELEARKKARLEAWNDEEEDQNNMNDTIISKDEDDDTQPIGISLEGALFVGEDLELAADDTLDRTEHERKAFSGEDDNETGIDETEAHGTNVFTTEESPDNDDDCEHLPEELLEPPKDVSEELLESSDDIPEVSQPEEKFYIQLKRQLNTKTKHMEFVLPHNLQSLQNLAKQNSAHRERYNERLIADRLPDCAKTVALLGHLKKIKQEAPNDRIIIFSEWVTMLDFIDAILFQGQEFEYRRYDGSMSATRKAGVVKEFQDITNDVRVLLCSTIAGNCGLNLTAANRIILFEPHYNPYVEDQAIDRCHRIGQTKEVYITRIIVPDTIEAKILKIHERKRTEVDGAIDGKAMSTGQETLTNKDYAYLLGDGEL